MNGKKIIKREKRDFSPPKYNKKQKIYMLSAAVLGVFVVTLLLLWAYYPRENPVVAEEEEVVVVEEVVKEVIPVEGGQLKIGISRFGSVDPYKNNDKSMDDFFRLIYDSLFEYDGNYNLVPELATGYTVGEEGKSITVTLNNAARWHDGSRVMPSDVVHTFNHIVANPESPYFNLVANISKATASGSTVTFELKNPNALEVYNLIFPIISPKSQGAKTILSDNAFGVIGNGMFKVEGYNKGKSILLRKNSEYYGAKPYINEIKAMIYADSTIRKNMFSAKETDLIESEYYELNKHDYDVFHNNSYQSRTFDFIAFNGSKAPFDQSYNRREIAKIIDIDLGLSDAYRQEAKVSQIPIANGSELNLLQNTLYDKESIKKISLIGTIPERLKIVTDKADPMKTRMAYLIKDQIALAGLDSDVVGLAAEELRQAIENGSFDIGVFSYEAPVDKDIAKIFASNPKLFPYNFEKLQTLMESVYKQGNKTFQMQNYLLAQEELHQLMPYLGIGFRNNYVIYNNKVQGKLQSNSFELFNGIENIFIVSN